MDHLLTCECGREHVVSKSRAGQEIQCDCGQTLQIPTLRGFSELPTVNDQPDADQRKGAWRGWRGPTMAFCAAIFLIALLYSGRAFLQSYRNQLNYDTQDYLADSNAAIDNYGPDELSMLWDNFQSIGLRQRVAPEYHIYNVYSNEQKIKGFIGLSVSLAFALGAAGIWFSARRQR